MKVTVDRIEENKAVLELECGKTVVVPIEILGDINEGDKLEITINKCNKTQNTDTHSIFEKLRNKSKNK